MDVRVNHWYEQNEKRVALSPDGRAVTVTCASKIRIEYGSQEIEIVPMISSENKRWIRIVAKNGTLIIRPVVSNAIGIEMEID